MRKLLLTALISVCSIFSYAQYIVFSYEGLVKHKPMHSQWINIKKNQTIGLSDSLYIGNAGKLLILNTNSSFIYESTKEGYSSLAQLITRAHKQSGRVIAELNREMYKNMSQHNEQPNKSFVGASYRGNEETFTDSLYSYLQTNIGTIKKGKNNFPVQTIKQKGISTLYIKNDSQSGHYVNVIVHNTKIDQKYCVFIALTQSDELYIPAGGTIKLDDFKFVPSKDIQYYLIASSLPFDSNHLQNLFNHNVSPIIFDKTDLVVVEKIKLH